MLSTLASTHLTCARSLVIACQTSHPMSGQLSKDPPTSTAWTPTPPTYAVSHDFFFLHLSASLHLLLIDLVCTHHNSLSRSWRGWWIPRKRGLHVHPSRRYPTGTTRCAASVLQFLSYCLFPWFSQQLTVHGCKIVSLTSLFETINTLTACSRSWRFPSSTELPVETL